MYTWVSLEERFEGGRFDVARHIFLVWIYSRLITEHDKKANDDHTESGTSSTERVMEEESVIIKAQ